MERGLLKFFRLQLGVPRIWCLRQGGGPRLPRSKITAQPHLDVNSITSYIEVLEYLWKFWPEKCLKMWHIYCRTGWLCDLLNSNSQYRLLYRCIIYNMFEADGSIRVKPYGEGLKSASQTPDKPDLLRQCSLFIDGGRGGGPPGRDLFWRYSLFYNWHTLFLGLRIHL